MSALLQRIIARTVAPRSDCQIWNRATRHGYGGISIGGRMYQVHRVVWELTRGPIPDGMTIDHLCRVRTCVNPDHMEVVTQAENYARSLPYRRRAQPRPAPKPPATECKQGHPYTPENTTKWAGGGRRCKECNRERMRLRRQRVT